MDYHQILRRSFEIVKREKALWVFGMVLAAFATGGGSLNGNFSGISEIFKNKEKIPAPSSEQITQVLGAATSNPSAFISSIFAGIPLSFWVALILGIVAIITFHFVLGIFLRNWATGAIFSLVSENDNMSLKKGSDFGRRSWKRLFIVSLILWGGFFFCALIGGLICLILLLLSQITFFKIISALFLVFMAFTAIVLAVIISLWEVFAEIVISIEDYSLPQSLSFSWKLTRRFFLEGMLMGLTNIGIGCLAGCLTMTIYLILAVFIFIGFLINKYIGIILLIIIGIPLVILFLGGILIQGIIKAFTSCNWVLFYQELKKKGDFPKD